MIFLRQAALSFLEAFRKKNKLENQVYSTVHEKGNDNNVCQLTFFQRIANPISGYELTVSGYELTVNH